MSFDVIEGGRLGLHAKTRNNLHEVAIDTLRLISAGRDSRDDLNRSVTSLVSEVRPEDLFVLHELIAERAKVLHDDVFGKPQDILEVEFNDVVNLSLRYAAEKMSHDPAAPARAGKYRYSLICAIKRFGKASRREIGW